MIFNQVRYDKVLRALHRRSANMLKNMLLNEESFVRAYLEYGARIETCRRMSLELFESTFRAAHPDMPTPKPSGGLGFGARVAWRVSNVGTIRTSTGFYDHSDANFTIYIDVDEIVADEPPVTPLGSTLRLCPHISYNTDEIGAYIPSRVTKEPGSLYDLLLAMQPIPDVDAEFIRVWDEYAETLSDTYADLDHWLQVAHNKQLEVEHIGYMLAHLAKAIGDTDYVPEFKRPPRKINSVNAPSTAIRKGLRLLASHSQLLTPNRDL